MGSACQGRGIARPPAESHQADPAACCTSAHRRRRPQEIGHDCTNWTPAVFYDLMRLGDGTGAQPGGAGASRPTHPSPPLPALLAAVLQPQANIALRWSQVCGPR